MAPPGLTNMASCPGGAAGCHTQGHSQPRDGDCGCQIIPSSLVENESQSHLIRMAVRQAELRERPKRKKYSRTHKIFKLRE